MEPGKGLRSTYQNNVSPKNLNGDMKDYLIVLKRYIGQLMDRAERLLPITKDKYGLKKCKFVRLTEPKRCSCCGEVLQTGSCCISSYLKIGKNCSSFSDYTKIYTCRHCIETKIKMAEVYNQEYIKKALEKEKCSQLESWISKPL